MRRHLVFFTPLIFCQDLLAAEFGGYVALTTDYVKRGVSQSDGSTELSYR